MTEQTTSCARDFGLPQQGPNAWAHQSTRPGKASDPALAIPEVVLPDGTRATDDASTDRGDSSPAWLQDAASAWPWRDIQLLRTPNCSHPIKSLAPSALSLARCPIRPRAYTARPHGHSCWHWSLRLDTNVGPSALASQRSACWCQALPGILLLSSQVETPPARCNQALINPQGLNDELRPSRAHR